MTEIEKPPKKEEEEKLVNSSNIIKLKQRTKPKF